jgi:hypothetical protein
VDPLCFLNKRGEMKERVKRKKERERVKEREREREKERESEMKQPRPHYTPSLQIGRVSRILL